MLTRDDIPSLDIIGKSLQGKEPSVDEQIENFVVDEPVIGGMDKYSGVCFTGNTKVKLSNGRQVSIKYLRSGMKVNCVVILLMAQE